MFKSKNNSDGISVPFNSMASMLISGGYLKQIPKDPNPSATSYYQYQNWCGKAVSTDTYPKGDTGDQYYRLFASTELPQSNLFYGNNFSVGNSYCYSAY